MNLVPAISDEYYLQKLDAQGNLEWEKLAYSDSESRMGFLGESTDGSKVYIRQYFFQSHAASVTQIDTQDGSDVWTISADELSDSPISEVLGNSAIVDLNGDCLLYTSPSPRDATLSRMPSSA